MTPERRGSVCAFFTNGAAFPGLEPFEGPNHLVDARTITAQISHTQQMPEARGSKAAIDHVHGLVFHFRPPEVRFPS